MTRNNYQHRPLYLRLANLAGGSAISLDPGKLIARAQNQTGLSDFGDHSWRDGFVRLCESLEDEARLNTVGRLSARTHLLQLLSNRLRIENHRKTNARVADQSITAPVIITGLPRSGSTLLHGLLAQDPAVRVPWTWEVMMPCRLGGQPRVHDRRRIERTERMLRWLHRLAPRFRTVHPTGAELPQECIAITAHEFASVEFHTTFDVPSYQRWLDEQDGVAAIGYHRRFLQHLQTENDTGRWFLKAPAHLHTLPALTSIYPDARFVFTRREPEKVAASIASHGVILRCAFSDRVDVEAVADYWVKWWAQGWRRAQQFRTSGYPVIDLEYKAIVADPIAVVRRLYAALDMELSDRAAQNMQVFLSANPQNKHGHHNYTLSEFGLNATDIRTSFGL